MKFRFFLAMAIILPALAFAGGNARGDFLEAGYHPRPLTNALPPSSVKGRPAQVKKTPASGKKINAPRSTAPTFGNSYDNYSARTNNTVAPPTK